MYIFFPFAHVERGVSLALLQVLIVKQRKKGMPAREKKGTDWVLEIVVLDILPVSELS